MLALDDTIAAIATPPGQGGIAIVRVSGPAAARVGEGLLKSSSGAPPTLLPRHAVFCRAHSADGVVIDEVLAVYMPAPASYTREDVLEIQCHGGHASARAVLDAVLAQGADVRTAGPGEFTLRAFLRGRIDLVQAEAVADVINAETTGSLVIHEALLEGALSRTVVQWQERLREALMQIESYLDFAAEDDIPDFDTGFVQALLDEVADGMNDKIGSYAWGRTARDGLRVAIVGAPNVGKSSLLNRMAEEERAIVSATPGTTRDTIEVRINALGAPVHVIDTAGLRETVDEIEREGVDRARRAALGADLLLIVFDGGRELTSEELEETRKLAEIKEVLAIINKDDLGQIPRENLSGVSGVDIVTTCASEGRGITSLLEVIRDRAWAGESVTGSEPLTRLRHRETVENALASVERARTILGGTGYVDAAASELHLARGFLGELLGDGTPDEVLDGIFSEFCIGK